MEEDIDVFEYDNSEPYDAWWNEEDATYDDYDVSEDTVLSDVPSDVQDNEIAGMQEDAQFDELLETLTAASNYGTMGDYYNQSLGCYVFPNYEVYEYFIDIDVYGSEWTVSSDGHYVPVLYLEAYEGYITVDEDIEVLLTESELQSIETLESIRGILSVIKENNTTFFDDTAYCHNEMLEMQQETLEVLHEISLKEEGVLYGTMTECVLLSAVLGACLSHIFFGRMRVG